VKKFSATPLLVLFSLIFLALPAAAQSLDLAGATVVARGADAPLVEQTAAAVLVEEVQKRSGITLQTSTQWPDQGVVIALASGDGMVGGKKFPLKNLAAKAEGYAIATCMAEASDRVELWIVGADPSGVLYGVGKLLRTLRWGHNTLQLDAPLDIVSAPNHTIRGHQLGYRPTANSYDAWTPAQYDQYIRELALFGLNAIENIPFQDSESPLFPVSRKEMNKQLGLSCEKYGVDYWVWTPATADLTDAAKRAELLAQHETFYQESSRIDAVFFPGGDPGHNHPKLMMPFLADAAKLLAKYHPGARVWMSPQGFDEEQVDYFFNWINENKPDWFGGVVGGPSSPPLPEMRKRLDKKYRLRDYPDITHTVRSQYATVWIDPAFAYTSGREPINPEPIYYSTIIKAFAKDMDGFVTYSDGMHDDVNKTVWCLLGWDVNGDLRDGLIEYCRLFFRPDLAERAADGIYALEQNWAGPLATNGGVESTLMLWQELDRLAPELRDNWRWQMCQLKANYDAYVRARLIHEQKLELEANDALAEATTLGSDTAMKNALAALAKADTNMQRPELRARIEQLCADLNNSIGYQSSVERYGASSGQRSGVLDYVDHPLNNRWWIEDQFKEIAALSTEEEKIARLDVIRKWEHPGEGSFYDDIGNVGKSPHVIRNETLNTDPLQRRSMNPDFMWWDGGMTRRRFSWVSKMDWPSGLRYDGLDPNAQYFVRTTGVSQCLLRVNGELVTVDPAKDGKEIGDVKEFPIPAALYQEGTMILTFDVPHEPGINWRQMSRLSEVWLIKGE
jgi:hypothetical protein